MNAQPQPQPDEITPAQRPAYQSILLALDSSDHANRGIRETIALAGLSGATVTATHVYAARMHDLRFRQMEGGLPEQFRAEQELERQRTVHDDLITRGLSVITDSYLDQARRACAEHAIRYDSRPLEGKNYRALTQEANDGDYDLLVMGALGLGAIQGSRIGTVCDRVVRRTSIDTLVIKQPQRELRGGPIVAAIDGSARAWGGLLTAMRLAQAWEVPLHVVSAFDPYYHYVAFNRIAGVLSAEAGKVFRFKEQEQLHEEIIDSGLARIYQGHLTVAQSIAAEHDIEIHTELLDGKAHDAVERYVRKLDPALLVIGKLGIHADAGLDIGGNAENLLRNVDCAVLLSQREHRPRVDLLAEATTTWTHEAEQRLARAPEFVQNMARMAILRYAQEQGHTVITERLVEEATARLMPERAEAMLQDIVAHADAAADRTQDDEPLRWSAAAQARLDGIADDSLRENLKMRAEKKARAAGTQEVELVHIQSFLDAATPTGSMAMGTDLGSVPIEPALHWQADALARLMRAPAGFMREMAKQRIEDYARGHHLTAIDIDTAEAGLAAARQAMAAQQGATDRAAPTGSGKASKCPFAGLADRKRGGSKRGRSHFPEPQQTDCQEAPEKMTPTPFAQMGSDFIESDPIEAPMTPGSMESDPIEQTPFSLHWAEEAQQLLENVPAGYCRDMTVAAAETIARQKGLSEIDRDFIQTVLGTFAGAAQDSAETLPWDDAARARIARAPDRVRGMLIREIEGWARRHALTRVTEAAADAVKQQWAERGVFHLDPADPRHHG